KARQKHVQTAKPPAQQSAVQSLSLGEALEEARSSQQSEAWGRVIQIAAAMGIRAGKMSAPGSDATRGAKGGPDEGEDKLRADLAAMAGDAHLRLGLKLRCEGKFAPAEAELKKAVVLLPADPRPWYSLGVLQHERGRPAE